MKQTNISISAYFLGRVLLMSIACVVLSLTCVQGQSSVAIPILWFRADSLQMDSVWQNQSCNEFNAGSIQGMFNPKASTLNYNPAIELDSAFIGAYVPVDSLEKGMYTTMMVYHSAMAEPEYGIWQYQPDTSSSLGLTTRRIIGKSSEIIYAKRNNTIPILNVLTQKWPQPDSTAGMITLGQCDSLAFNGLLAEYLLFDKNLTARQSLIWQSALAIKYGITLYGSTYLNSCGDTIWGTDKHKGLDMIAGIHSDTSLAIIQRQSRAYEDVLSIALGSLAATNESNPNALPHGESIMWGNDGRSFVFDSLYLPIPLQGFQVMNRRWMISPTGNSARNTFTSLCLEDSTFAVPGFASVVLLVWSNPDDTMITVPMVYQPSFKDTLAGKVVFSGLKWDADSSGADLFTLAIAPPVQLRSGNPDLLNSEDAASLVSYNIRPNPTSGEFELAISLSSSGQVDIRISDMAGRLVSTAHLADAQDHLYRGQVPGPGTYMVEIRCANESTTLKLIAR